VFAAETLDERVGLKLFCSEWTKSRTWNRWTWNCRT